MPAAMKARQIAEQHRSIEASEHMQGKAAYNAAWCYVKGSDPARARPQLDRALQDDVMKTKAKAQQLLHFLNKQ